MGRITVINKSELDALTFSNGTFGLYSFSGYSGNSVESDDGLLLVSYNFMYKWGKNGKAAYRTFADTTWHFVNEDFPSFYKNYGNVKELGIGAATAMCIALNDADANALTAAGMYQSNNWTNAPQAAGIIIMPFYAEGYWRFQLFTDTSSQMMYFRSGTSASWSTWKRVSLV